MKRTKIRAAGHGRIALMLLGFLLFLLPAATMAATPEGQEEQQMAGILYARAGEGGAPVFLPLKRTGVYLEFIGGIVKAEVTQVFTNDTESALEAVYVFPLPAKAAVTDMVLTVGNRRIKSVVKERKEAKRVYEAAKAQGKKTALLEQERPNIFTTSVANFMPGETVEISLYYLEEVDFREGVYGVNFPMVVGQRYIPCAPRNEGIEAKGPAVDTGVPDAHRINPPLLHPNLDSEHRLSLTVDVKGVPVKDITSSTHRISVSGSSGGRESYRVTLADELTVPDGDFNMKIRLKELSNPQLQYVHSNKGENTYGMLTVFPPLSGGVSPVFSRPRDVVFLIDTSGSMSGASIHQAKTGLVRCLKMLRPEDRFTIVRFASDYSAFSGAVKPANASILEEARNYIYTLEADGGTEMQQALRYVLGISGRDEAMKMIVFLTDGDVGNEDSLLRLLDGSLGGDRLFTFGIGSAPNEYLMRKMAEIGRGQSRFIRAQEDIGEVMADFFDTLENPVLTDISLSWVNGSGVPVEGVEFYPNPCPDVFYKRPLQVFAKVPGTWRGEVVITGVLGNRRQEYRCRLDSTEDKRLDLIDRVFGRKKIKELMFRRLCSSSPEDKEQLKNEVIQVSLEHQVVSKFTSRVAVEERISRNPQENLGKVKQAVPLPKGWNPAKFHSTATNNMEMLLIGVMMLLGGIAVYVIRRVLGQ